MTPTTAPDEDETLFETHIASLPLIARGKVRDNYAVGEDRILMVASDRLSAFDVVMNEPIPGKGRILTEMALFWFDKLKHIVPNHLTGDDPESVVATEDERRQVRGRSMLVRRLQPIPIEAVVRGYLAGSAWKEYQASGAVCGVPLPPGLLQASKLPAPIFTPATKAAMGDHDENIDFARMSDQIGADLAARIRDISIRLYTEAAAYAETRGILIADTKFEFGVDGRGALLWMDEALTPDSSRYWPERTYKAGISPPSYDKQSVRDWLESVQVDGKSWNKHEPPPSLPSIVVARTSDRYRAAKKAIASMNNGIEKKHPQLAAMTHSINLAQNESDGDKLRAEYAALLSRYRYQSAAEAAISSLRMKYAQRANRAVTPWLNCAEAIIDLRGGRGAMAEIKFQRAKAMASASGVTSVHSLASAWLGHLLWNSERVEPAVEAVREALRVAASDDHAARWRASLVLAEILALSDREQRATEWFIRARLHALAGNDDASKAAVNFNIGIIKLMILRQEVLSETESENRSIDLATTFWRISVAFDHALNLDDDSFSHIHRAQILSLTGRMQESLLAYEDDGIQDSHPDSKRLYCVWRADQAWCYARLGDLKRATELAALAEAAIDEPAQIDDLASTYSMLSRVNSALGNHTKAASLKGEASQRWLTYRNFQLRCAALSEAVTERG